MDPATMKLLSAILPSLLGFGGGLLDQTDEKKMAMEKEQFNKLFPLKQAETGIGAGSFLSKLLEQRQNMQNQQGVGAGFMAGMGR